MQGRQKSGGRRPSKAVISDSAEYFCDQLAILRRRHTIFDKDVVFTLLVNLSPSYLSKMKKGVLTTYENITYNFLPVLIAFGAIVNAQEARRWIEPAYSQMSKEELFSIRNRILSIHDRSLTKNDLISRTDAFISSIEPSFTNHPARYTLDEVRLSTPPPIQKIKAKLKRLERDRELMDYCRQLAQYHSPEIELLLIEEAKLLREGYIWRSIIESIAISGGNEAVRSLPKLLGENPLFVTSDLIALLPKDTVHQSKEIWVDLFNHSALFYRRLAASVFARDPDQCEILRVVKRVFDDKETSQWGSSELTYDADGIILIPALLYLVDQIRKVNLFQTQLYSHPDWRINILERSLKRLTEGGRPIPEELRTPVIEALLAYLDREPHPTPEAFGVLAYPDFKNWAKEIAHLIDWKFPLYLDTPETEIILFHAIETLIFLGAPNIKQYLLDIYKHASTRETILWACKTLMTKTDKRFNLIQRLRYNMNEIEVLACYS